MQRLRREIKSGCLVTAVLRGMRVRKYSYIICGARKLDITSALQAAGQPE